MMFRELLQALLDHADQSDGTDQGENRARLESTDAPTIDFGHYTGKPAIGVAGAMDTATPDDQCGCSSYPDKSPPPDSTPGLRAGATMPRRVGVIQVSTIGAHPMQFSRNQQYPVEQQQGPDQTDQPDQTGQYPEGSPEEEAQESPEEEQQEQAQGQGDRVVPAQVMRGGGRHAPPPPPHRGGRHAPPPHHGGGSHLPPHPIHGHRRMTPEEYMALRRARG